MFEYAETARETWIESYYCWRWWRAHLPGWLQRRQILPVIGVPFKSKSIKRFLDSLLPMSKCQEVFQFATVAIGKAGSNECWITCRHNTIGSILK
ncbi:hypothetical protein CW304_22255 [Bacillus sp. UFRGS-B20]|nr:hypothetical protein CW304_22255 [Bacillus sp. UFRGS-B20]